MALAPHGRQSGAQRLHVSTDQCSKAKLLMPDTGDNESACDVTMGEGFPRSARLLTARDYSAAFKKNKRLSDHYWTVLAHRSDNAVPRLGLAIAKKRAKRAVDRNRIKRIARESFRHQQQNLSHTELVIMNRDHTAKTDSRTLREALDRLLKRLS